MSEHKFKYVGTRPIRHDGVDKVTGRADFGADFSLPGMIYAACARSPHAHARILSIDTSKAEALAGVCAVITGKDLPEVPSFWNGTVEQGLDFGELADRIIARDKALFHGHPVAAVAAVSEHVAREACKLIDVEYEVLKPVMTIDDALADDAPILHPDQEPLGFDPKPEKPSNNARRISFQRGNLEEGFDAADIVVEREFETVMVHQGYIEPHACVVRSNEDGRIVIWCSTQGPFLVQLFSALVLGMDPASIKVIPSEIGGGFGGKTTIYLEPLAIVLSRKAGRPVKMVMSREEVFRATGPNSGAKVTLRLGAKSDGTLVAADTQMWFEAGAYRGSPVGGACMTIFGTYRIPHFSIEGFDVVLNKPQVAAYRAPGAPIGNFAIEQCMDELALELGIDPIELRLRNAVVEGDHAPYGPAYQAIGLRETLQAAKNHPHYKAPLAENQGRGVACGFWFNAGLQSSAIVGLNSDGSAIVRTGNPDIGGSRVSMAIMAAEELGIPVERIRPTVGDTDSIGYGDLTGGSRVTYATGMAVIQAAQDVIEQLRARAAMIWDVDVEDVVWKDGATVGTNGASDKDPLSLAELAGQMADTGGPIMGRASVNAATAGPAFATHLCDLEVDQETGRSKVVRYTTIQDAGRAIHPGYVEGQFQGGAAQGIGWALNEEYLWDEDGAVDNASFLDYRIPVASDLPMIDTVIVEVPSSGHPYGIRGVGEVPIVPPLATVANAMHDATGIRFDQLPLSPPRVLDAIEKRQS